MPTSTSSAVTSPFSLFDATETAVDELGAQHEVLRGRELGARGSQIAAAREHPGDPQLGVEVAGPGANLTIVRERLVVLLERQERPLGAAAEDCRARQRIGRAPDRRPHCG